MNLIETIACAGEKLSDPPAGKWILSYDVIPSAQASALRRQLPQLLDAALVFAAFFAATNLLAPGDQGFFQRQGWMLYIVVPFSPLVLEAVGFYRHPARRTTLRLFAGLTLIGAALAVFAAFGAGIERPSWLALGFPFAFILLRARDAFVARFPESGHGRGLP